MDKLTANLKAIESAIGYKFEDEDLLIQAFIRKSYASENGGNHNEVLEWVGDAVLYNCVTQLILFKYGHLESEDPDFDDRYDYDGFYTERYKDEGKLSKLRDSFINKKSLANSIEALGFNEFLLMGKGDINKNLQNEVSVKEDLFEAILGAVAIDCDHDNETLLNVVDLMLRVTEKLDSLTTDEIDYIEEIQHWCQKNLGELPLYKYYDPLAPNNLCFWGPNNTQYFKATLEFRCGSKMLSFEGLGNSKVEARLMAAKKAYEFLYNNDLLFTIEDELPENVDLDNAVNVLQELHQKGYISKPLYEFEKDSYIDDDGVEMWTCNCWFDEEEFSTSWSASSKKRAKKLCAYEILCEIFDWENKYDN